MVEPDFATPFFVGCFSFGSNIKETSQGLWLSSNKKEKNFCRKSKISAEKSKGFYVAKGSNGWKEYEVYV